MTNQRVETKALPSQPVWSNLSLDFGYWSTNRQKLYELMALYQKNDVVHACIDLIAKAVVAANPMLVKVVNKGAGNLAARRLKRLSKARHANIKRQFNDGCIRRKNIGDDKELVEVESSPFWAALDNDSDGLNLLDKLRLWTINMCAIGIAFGNKDQDILGQTEIRYLPSYNVSPDRDGQGHLVGWFYTSTIGDMPKKEPIELEDITIFRWPSATDPLASGDSPLLSCLAKVQLTQKFEQWQDWLLNNRARPEGMFVPKLPDNGTISQEQADRIEKKVNDKLKGAGNGRWVTAEYAGQWVPLTFSPTDLAPLQFNEELRKALYFCLGVPESYTNNDGNRANAFAAHEQFARHTLAPLIAQFEKVLTKEAQQEDPDYLVIFENVIPHDEEQALEVEKVELEKWQIALEYGGIDNDEYRVQVLGIEPKAEAELYEEKPEPEPTPAPAAKPDQAGDDQANQDDPQGQQNAPETTQSETEGNKSFDLLKLNTAVAKGRIDRATAISVAAHQLGLDEAQAKRLITHCLKKAKVKALPKIEPGSHEKLADTIRRQMDQQEAHYMAQLNGFKSLTSDIQTKSDALPDKFTRIEDWDAEDQYHYKPYLQVEMNTTAASREKALARAGADEDAFAVVPKNIDKAVDNASLAFAQSTNETTEQLLNDALDELRQELKESLAQGDSVQQMKNKVKAIFENIDNDRADLIARTEISRASHEAQKITAKASGIVKGFKLVVSPDCCDQCEALAGKEIDIDGKFDEDDNYSDTPVPVHPNCRCTMQEIIDLGDDD